jgi:hypothetical protein
MTDLESAAFSVWWAGWYDVTANAESNRCAKIAAKAAWEARGNSPYFQPIRATREATDTGAGYYFCTLGYVLGFIACLLLWLGPYLR